MTQWDFGAKFSVALKMHSELTTPTLSQSLRQYGGREVQNNITNCETLLRSSRQIYILENIFTYHKTQLHGKNTFTKDETNLHFRKQINKTQNTFTSPETNLQ